MVFLSSTPHLIVWDKDKRKRLCKFTEGQFRTEDKETIEKLKKLGFVSIEEKQPDDLLSMTAAELKELAKAKEIPSYSKMTKEELIKALEQRR